MRTLNFANRNFKEIIRDPLSIIFSILLPLFLLFIFQQFKIPNDIYSIENFTPGIILFSLSFLTLFTSLLVSNDRKTSFIIRLKISPMKNLEYVFGYFLSLLPLIIIQNILFFITASFLGLKVNINVLYTILISLLLSPLFIGLGIIIGSFTSEKSASGLASIVVQLTTFTSGTYFTFEMVGTSFATICKVLPFASSLNILKGVLNNNFSGITSSILIVSFYMIIVILSSIICLNNKIVSNDN